MFSKTPLCSILFSCIIKGSRNGLSLVKINETCTWNLIKVKEFMDSSMLLTFAFQVAWQSLLVLYKNCTGKWAGWAGRCLVQTKQIVTSPGEQNWITLYYYLDSLKSWQKKLNLLKGMGINLSDLARIFFKM